MTENNTEQKVNEIMMNITEDSNLCMIRQALTDFFDRESFTQEEKETLDKAMDSLIENEQDLIDHTALIEKIHRC